APAPLTLHSFPTRRSSDLAIITGQRDRHSPAALVGQQLETIGAGELAQQDVGLADARDVVVVVAGAAHVDAQRAAAGADLALKHGSLFDDELQAVVAHVHGA